MGFNLSGWKIATTLVAVVAFLIASALFFAWVDDERDRLAGLDRIVVEREPVVAPNSTGVTLWLADEAPVDVEPFDGRIFAATSAGLVVLDRNGTLLVRYTTLDGLPENSLTCLERFGDRLYIGTASSGMLAFDGERFERFRFRQPQAGHISALRAANGELLIGTFEAGLFEFDGTNFSRRYQRDFGDACRSVTAIQEHGARLLVGTFDSGLFVWREGSAANLGRLQGLPSDRVTGMAVRDAAVLVATDVGTVAVSDDGALEVVDRTPNVTGIVVAAGTAWVATLTHGVVAVGGSAGAVTIPVSDRSDAIPATRGSAEPVVGLEYEDGTVWALTRDGLLASPSPGTSLRFERFSAGLNRTSGLNGGHVSALAFDRAGRLWAGQFDGGIDLLDPISGERVARIADPDLVEINALLPDPDADRMWVAASKGVGVFEAGRRSRLLGEREGLVAANVAALAAGEGESLAIATNRGISLYDGTVARSLTAFHGLPNNHVYALATHGGRTYVGTLGGLAEVSSLRVDRVFTAADSALPHNWVNALAVVDGRLFIGTYGGGVAELLSTGEIVVAEETAGLEVNPGAMAVVDRRLYVGTLGSGVYVLDLDTGVWTRITAVLSSTNVTAIAADDEHLYFGTEHGITRVDRSALL